MNPGGTIHALLRGAGPERIPTPASRHDDFPRNAMSSKKILILDNDLLLSNLYRERLEAEGFMVESARTGAACLRAMSERPPDALVVDSVIPSTDVVEVITSLRAQKATSKIPIIVLPTARSPLADAAQEAGATQVLKRSVNPIADLIDALEVALGMKRTSEVTKRMPFRADESWLKLSLDSAKETITAMRRALHGISRDSSDASAARDLFQQVHQLTEQMAVLNQKPVFHLTSAMEALIFDLYRLPDHANPSIIRTLGQGLDFLANLLIEKNRLRANDPAMARVLIVDDEDGARKIVTASMQLVNLKPVSAATPTAALIALGAQEFDLIFLDVGLPEMDGFELCGKVRALPAHKKTPVVFITGMATFQNRVQSSLSGGNDFVGKPFSVPEMALKALIWVFKGQLGFI
jgi:DNA-binding response OmpR family regulator